MTNNSRKPGVCIGLTGGLACGKSTVGEILQKAGVDVLDADLLAHQYMEVGTEAHAAIVERFGKRILTASGEIDRAKLGAVVFGHASELEGLNEILHPLVRQEWRRWVDEKRVTQADAAVIIPLLFEVGETENWDAIICVKAADDVVKQRLRDRGLTDEQILARLGSQWPVEQKAAASDYVIDNDGSIADLETKTKEILELIISKER